VKTLITGGLGFIGHNLVKALDQQGHQVSIIDNTTDYGVCDSREIKSLITQRLATIPENVIIYRADINNYSDFCSIFNCVQAMALRKNMLKLRNFVPK